MIRMRKKKINKYCENDKITLYFIFETYKTAIHFSSIIFSYKNEKYPTIKCTVFKKIFYG